MKINRLCFAFSLIMLLTHATGCWDRRELNQLAIVFGAGLDKKGDLFLLTTQIIKPSEIRSQGGGGGSGTGKNSSYIVNSTGETIFDAVRNANFIASRRLYFPQNRVIIIGNSVAKQGVLPALDFFLRDPSSRPDQWVLVAQDKAGDVFKPNEELEPVSSVAIRHKIDNFKLTSKVSAMDLQDFFAGLISETTSALAPIIKVTGQGEEKKLIVNGTAVFKKDKMVGTLDQRETRGFQWATGNPDEGIVVVHPSGAKGKVSLEVLSSEGKFTPKILKDEPRIDMSIYVVCRLGDQTSSQNFTSPTALKYLANDGETVIRNEILSAFRKAKSLKADFWGFGDAFSQDYPKQWGPMKTQWDDRFSKIKLNIKVHVRLRNVGEFQGR